MIGIQKLLKYTFLFFGCMAILQSCNIINPAESTPTYIHIDSVQFVKGTNPDVNYSSNITSIWVYYNNSPVGEFDLPATFPVLATGTGTLKVWPAIKVNGLNADMMQYPFYTTDTFTFSAQPGAVINHTPRTGFYNDVKFTFICNQYDIGLAHSDGQVSVQFVGGTDSQSYFGQACAGIFLNAVGDSSIDSSIVPRNGFSIDQTSAFIEFNYKGTVPFYVGLQATIAGVVSSTPYYLTGIFPNGTWQKFYLNVGDFNAKYNGTNYRFYVKANLADGQTSGKLLLDNVQLVQF